jgi:hypothetical protein
MTRRLRIEVPGAHYHITSRGDAHEDIDRGEGDRRTFLNLLADVYGRKWSVNLRIGLGAELSSNLVYEPQLRSVQAASRRSSGGSSGTGIPS